ncbi:MAG TPA: selenium metabolism-associated LysR family transcriptional regulator [Vicinamibacterales bacterium]|nr:selenium metabolism-associated LysR family transcriptional regulator [Vicinamibacterales bacterium]
MDLRLVEIFCRVYDERSFSKAARQLGLTQPTVSAHVRELEETVGTALFNRLGREIEPTEAGRFLRERAGPVLASTRALAAEMATFVNRVAGVLTIGASSVPGEFLLPGIVTRFHERYPEVRTRLRISDTGQTIDDVRHGTVELGVVGAAAPDEDLAFEPFAEDELVLAVPAARGWPSRPQVSFREVAALPLFVREPGSGTRGELERALRRHKLALGSFRIAAELGSAGAIIEAVRGGHGISFVSRIAVAADAARGVVRLAHLRELGRVRRAYHTVTSRRRHLSPATRAFLEFIRPPAPRTRTARRVRPAVR